MPLTINLNLPTLPTSDQKDAMDNANIPDITNPFATLNDIPAAQVNSDWNATSGVAEILNKPTIPSTATDVDALKRDGSNANSDVDLGSFGLNAKTINIKGTGGTGHIGLKHQSANITANTSESSIGADVSGNPVWKNDGNAIQQIQLNDSVNNATSYTTPINGDKIGIWDSTNSILKAITWTNIKASLKTYFDTVYTTTSAVATQITTALSGYATQSWVTAQGYITNVVTALGYTPEDSANKSSSYTASSTTTYANTKALVDGLATKVTANVAITGATKTKITYDANGLVTSGTDATTADIADSTNKRYQTDAQQTYNDATSSIQTQLNGKEPTLSAGTSAQYYRGDKTWQTLNTAAISGYQGYTLNGATVKNGGNPTDATTYFFGATNATVISFTASGRSQIYIPKAGTIKQVRITIDNTAGTNESSTMYIRLNNTTDTTISSSIANNAASQTYALTSSIAVVAGDYVEFKWVCPTWTTNPTNVGVNWELYIE